MADRQIQQRVYFIQSGDCGPIKIGIAEDAKTRMRQMQTGCPDPLRLLGTLPGGAGREAALHRHLSAHRVRGEWFSPTAEVLAFVPGVDTSGLITALGGVSRREAFSYKLNALLTLVKAATW